MSGLHPTSCGELDAGGISVKQSSDHMNQTDLVSHHTRGLDTYAPVAERKEGESR